MTTDPTDSSPLHSAEAIQRNHELVVAERDRLSAETARLRDLAKLAGDAAIVAGAEIARMRQVVRAACAQRDENTDDTEALFAAVDAYRTGAPFVDPELRAAFLAGVEWGDGWIEVSAADAEEAADEYVRAASVLEVK